MSYTMHWGKDKDGNAIARKNGGAWRVMNGADPERVKTCALEVWTWGGRYEGKTIKEIASEDAEYLEFIMDMIEPGSAHMDCVRLLLGKK